MGNPPDERRSSVFARPRFVIGIGLLDPHVKCRGERSVGVSGHRVQDRPFGGEFVDDGHSDVLHHGKGPLAVQSEVRRALPLDWPIAVHVEMPLRTRDKIK
jgi:hypothetical protein